MQSLVHSERRTLPNGERSRGDAAGWTAVLTTVMTGRPPLGRTRTLHIDNRVRAEIHAVAGEFHERRLQRHLLEAEFVHGDVVQRGDVADVGAVEPGHRERAVDIVADDRAGTAQPVDQPLPMGRPDPDVVVGAAPDEVLDTRVRDQPAAADHDQVVGGQGHLAHEVTRDEDRPALGRERLQHRADPQDALGIEPVDRLVEHQHAGITEQCGRDTQPLAHAQRERVGALAGDPGQADPLEHCPDPEPRNAVALRQDKQVVVGRTTAVDRCGVQQRADLEQWPPVLLVRPAVDGRPAAGRVIQTEDHPHRRRFPRPVGAKEPGHHPGSHLEGQVLHRDRRTEPLGEVVHLDHGGLPSAMIVAAGTPAAHPGTP